MTTRTAQQLVADLLLSQAQHFMQHSVLLGRVVNAERWGEKGAHDNHGELSLPRHTHPSSLVRHVAGYRMEPPATSEPLQTRS